MEKISIIIPVYNEDKNIRKVISKVIKSKIKNSSHEIKKELIIVDDKSTDNTRNILKTLEGKNIKKIYHEKNSGKGAAIRTGLSKSSGEIIIIQDADLEYNPEEYQKLINPILEEKTKVVYGSRFLNKKKNENQKFLYYMGNKTLSKITSLLYFRKITDMETCYKVIKKEVINELNLESNQFEIEPEITSKLVRKGYKIIEVPISYFPRNKQEGKKIKPSDFLKAITALLKFRFKKI